MTCFSTHPMKWHYFLAFATAFMFLDLSTARHQQALKVGDWNVSITTNPAQHKATNEIRYRRYRREDDSDIDPKILVKELEEKILNRVSKENNVSNEKPKPRMSIGQAKELYRRNNMKKNLRGRESAKFLKSPELQGTFTEGSLYERKAYADNSKQAPMKKNAINRGRRGYSDLFSDYSDFRDYRMRGNKNGGYERDVSYKNSAPGARHLYSEDTDKSNYKYRRAPIRELSIMHDDDDGDDDDDDDKKMSQRETESLSDAEAVFLDDPKNYEYFSDPESYEYNSDYMDDYENSDYSNDDENLDDGPSADVNDNDNDADGDDNGDLQSDTLDDHEHGGHNDDVDEVADDDDGDDDDDDDLQSDSLDDDERDSDDDDDEDAAGDEDGDDDDDFQMDLLDDDDGDDDDDDEDATEDDVDGDDDDDDMQRDSLDDGDDDDDDDDLQRESLDDGDDDDDDE